MYDSTQPINSGNYPGMPGGRRTKLTVSFSHDISVRLRILQLAQEQNKSNSRIVNDTLKKALEMT